VSKIEWNDSFSVNNAEIDNQHKKWIEIYNQMHDRMIDTTDIDYNGICKEALSSMHDYARTHFRFEEEYLEKIRYPEIVKHRRKHKDFSTMIYSYLRGMEEGKLILNTEVIKLIKNWLLDHIMIEDKKFATFLKEENKI